MKIMLGAPDRQVRDPITGALVPPEGREVNEHDLYWARRLRDGDVIEAPPPGPPPETRAHAPRSKES